MADSIEEQADQLDHVDRLRRQWAAELPDLDTSAMETIGRAYRLTALLRPLIERNFARFGLDRGEFDVLATLRRSGRPYRMVPTELYDALMVASGSLTHRLGRLEKAGLVRRQRSDQDRRSLSVELTEKGRETVEAAFRADMSLELEALSAMTEDERENLARLLRKLIHSIETGNVIQD